MLIFDMVVRSRTEIALQIQMGGEGVGSKAERSPTPLVWVSGLPITLTDSDLNPPQM